MANLDDLRRRLVALNVARAQRAAPVLQTRLRDAAPTLSGTMRDQTTVTPSGLTVVVEVRTDYASFTVEGTDPHPIVGNPILSFFWERLGRQGRQVFFHSVDHPGTAPNNWYNPVLRTWPEILQQVGVS